MITKFILPVLAVLMLGSCANKFSLVKRKYNKGYYLDMSRNNTQKKHDNEKALVLKSKKNERTVVSNDSEKAEIKVSDLKPVELQNTIATLPAAKKHKAVINHKSQPVTASAAKKSMLVTNSFKPLNVNAIQLTPGKGNSDTNLIILVILCFLWWLNLIAVYIHDGKKITLNFWITLLLDFTFIGGVIFSLLVVLDIINLA